MSDKDVEVLKRDVQRILSYLHNDEGTGEKGLVAEVRDLKANFSNFVSAYKLEKAVKKATIGAWATIGGIVALVAKWIVTLVFEHFHF